MAAALALGNGMVMSRFFTVGEAGSRVLTSFSPAEK